MLFSQIFYTKPSLDTPIKQWFAEVCKARKHLSRAGVNIDDHLVCLGALARVPDDYQHVSHSILAGAGERPLQLDNVEAALIGVEVMKVAQVVQKGGEKQVFMVEHKSRKPCSYCNKPGHNAESCRMRMADEQQNGKGSGSASGSSKGKERRDRNYTMLVQYNPDGSKYMEQQSDGSKNYYM